MAKVDVRGTGSTCRDNYRTVSLAAATNDLDQASGGADAVVKHRVRRSQNRLQIQ
jgi:hypothetical protein